MAELERLTRLFQDILDMARIDAEAIRIERQWVTAGRRRRRRPGARAACARGTRAARRGRRGHGGRDRPASDLGGAVARDRECGAVLAGRPADSRAGAASSATACTSRSPIRDPGSIRASSSTCSSASIGAARRGRRRSGPAWVCRSRADCCLRPAAASGRRTCPGRARRFSMVVPGRGARRRGGLVDHGRAHPHRRRRTEHHRHGGAAAARAGVRRASRR